MERIEIRGIICGSEWDGDGMFGYIQRGIFTPESYFRKQIAKLSGKKVEIYINSYGGSVFAANEMLNAVRDWKGSPIITLGALAASAAANFALLCGCPVRAHSNTRLMFHGATTATEGGEGAHKDSAELVARINEDVMAALTAKGVPTKQVAEWFSEGRMGWLSADEALKYGIVDEIIETKGEMPKTEAMFGFDLAAFALPKQEDEMELEKLKQELEAAEALVAEATTKVDAVEAKNAELIGEIGKVKISAEKDAAKIAELTAEGQKRADTIAQQDKQLAELTEKYDNAIAGARMSMGDSHGKSWRELVAEYGYVEACRKFPESKPVCK